MRMHYLFCGLMLAACTSLAQGAVVTTQPATAPAAAEVGADAIHTRLQKAKEVYDQEVDGAKKRLAAYFGSRADAAQKQGDLTALKNFSGMKQAFESDGTLPENVADLSTRENINSYLFGVRVATRNLSSAYGAGVKDYTKAGMIAEADALQAEADAFQKTAGVAVAATTGGAGAVGSGAAVPPVGAAIGNGHPFAFTKASGLPKLFEANPNVQLADGGLVFPSLTYLRSTRSDFINLDFTLDVLVTVKAKEQLSIGIGPAVAGKATMAGIRLTTGGMALDEYVGELGKVGPGTHLFRLEKHGMELTTAIVLNYSGKFVPDYKKTGSLRGMRWLTAENSHLFVAATGDGVAIKELRISQ